MSARPCCLLHLSAGKKSNRKGEHWKTGPHISSSCCTHPIKAGRRQLLRYVSQAAVTVLVSFQQCREERGQLAKELSRGIPERVKKSFWCSDTLCTLTLSKESRGDSGTTFCHSRGEPVLEKSSVQCITGCQVSVYWGWLCPWSALRH